MPDLCKCVLCVIMLNLKGEGVKKKSAHLNGGNTR